MSRRRGRQPIHIELMSGSHQVIVRAPISAKKAADVAMRLWRDTTPPSEPGDGDATVSLGFQVSDPQPTVVMPPEVTLPDRMIPEQEIPDDHDHIR